VHTQPFFLWQTTQQQTVVVCSCLRTPCISADLRALHTHQSHLALLGGTHPISHVTVPSASLPHGLHVMNRGLFVFAGGLHAIDHVATESALTDLELSRSLLKPLHHTSSSCHPLALGDASLGGHFVLLKGCSCRGIRPWIANQSQHICTNDWDRSSTPH